VPVTRRVLFVLTLAACGGGEAAQPTCLFPDGGATAPVDLDLLFLVDNTSSADVQEVVFTQSFAQMTRALAALPGGMPNLHIGVASSDLGAGPYTLRSCEHPGGDQGLLQNTPRVPGCTAPSERYLSDVGGVTNFTGTIADAVHCIAPLGVDGCGFEQELEGMKRALDGSAPENAGFLRPNALLAVVILADEDDCSAKPPYAIYDPAPAAATTFGALASYRCTQFGLRCDPDLPWTMTGPRQGCESNESSPYLEPVQKYVDFLTRLKGDPRKVFVEAIVGDAGPVVVGLDAQSNPLLLPSCTAMRTQNGDAVPGVRLTQLARAFDGSVFSFCADDKTFALMPLVNQLDHALACR
jgi:hypothetical protein